MVLKPVVNNGIKYQPQLVLAGFLKHQQYVDGFFVCLFVCLLVIAIFCRFFVVFWLNECVFLVEKTE